MITAIVMVSAMAGSPFLTFHISLPVLASSATSVLSAWARKTLPSA